MMNEQDIKNILEEHDIENSENLSKALAQVLEEFSKNSNAAAAFASSIDAHNEMRERMSGVVR